MEYLFLYIEKKKQHNPVSYMKKKKVSLFVAVVVNLEVFTVSATQKE